MQFINEEHENNPQRGRVVTTAEQLQKWNLPVNDENLLAMAVYKAALTDEKQGNILSAAKTYRIQLSSNPKTSLRAEFLRRLTDFVRSKQITPTLEDLNAIKTIVTTTTESTLTNATSKPSVEEGMTRSEREEPIFFGNSLYKVGSVLDTFMLWIRQALGAMLVGAEWRQKVIAANGIIEVDDKNVPVGFSRPVRALDLNATQIKYLTDRMNKVERWECHECKVVEGGDVKLRKCSQCQRIWFCSKEGQKKAWKPHKKSCRELNDWKCGDLAMMKGLSDESLNGKFVEIDFRQDPLWKVEAGDPGEARWKVKLLGADIMLGEERQLGVKACKMVMVIPIEERIF
ncbi:hypothetical protein HDU76_013997 [Blyttiomyces sp. JEL0837]|nr:hypothetical protein HDU76_013997 [Blyttiomyces sp. JEL0837]